MLVCSGILARSETAKFPKKTKDRFVLHVRQARYLAGKLCMESRLAIILAFQELESDNQRLKTALGKNTKQKFGSKTNPKFRILKRRYINRKIE